ncbi:hypothetical protein BCR44DRAFT_1434724 [Catenaria anguillulae PL171]|nr:hypothetical protein BCR44DRAFT_1434724 [Catenaria anguillulae PL171]
MEIEFRPDGTYSYTTYLKCLAANCVGEGAYFYNPDSRTLHLRQRIEGRSTVSQYWQLGKMTRDRDVSLIWDNKLVKTSGVNADLYPIPAKQAGEMWTRI